MAEQREIRMYHIAHVREIPTDVDVAYFDDRCPPPLLNLGNLACEVRHNKPIALPPADVVERSGQHDLHRFADRPLIAQSFGGELAYRIRIAWRGQSRLGDRHHAIRHAAVDVARADKYHPPTEPGLLQRLQQMKRSENINV